MEKTMTTTTPRAATTQPAPARVRMSAGAFTGAGALGGQGFGCATDARSWARVDAYTPAIVDVVRDDVIPGVHAWSPPVW